MLVNIAEQSGHTIPTLVNIPRQGVHTIPILVNIAKQGVHNWHSNISQHQPPNHLATNEIANKNYIP